MVIEEILFADGNSREGAYVVIEEGDDSTRTGPKWKNKQEAKAKMIYITCVGKIIINKRCIPGGMPTLKKKK